MQLRTVLSNIKTLCLCKVCLYSLCRSQAHHFLHHLLLAKLTHSWDSICTERVNARQLFSQLPAKWGNGSGGIPTLLRVVNPLSFLPCLPALLPPPLPPPNGAAAVNKPGSVVLQIVIGPVRVDRAVQSAAGNSPSLCPLRHTTLTILK